MNGPTIQQMLADLSCAFPRQQVTAGTLGIYLRELSDLDPATLEVAVRELIRTSEFFPTVRTIRLAVAERTLALSDEAGAVAQVEALIAWGNANEDERPERPPELHPAVREALVAVGGTSTFREAQASVIRGQFGRYYREIRARYVQTAQVGQIEPAARPREIGA